MKRSRSTLILNIVIPVLVLLAIAGLLIWKSGVLAADPVVEVAADNCYAETLTVITDRDYRPYSFYDRSGAESGHDVELIILLANALQKNLDLQFLPWDEAIRSMEEGRADVLMTCDLKDTFDGGRLIVQTEPVSKDEFVVYSKKNIRSVDELYGMHCAVMENGNVLAQINLLHLTSNSIRYPDNRAALTAVEEGTADCAIMRNTIGEALLKELGYRDLAARISIGESYMCFAVGGENEELAEQLNSAIESLKKDGTMENLQAKWLTTFVHDYTVSELLLQNIWVLIVFMLLAFAILSVLVLLAQRRVESERDKNRYLEIVENLANDFESVSYIVLHANKLEDEDVMVRMSETLERNVPGWTSERSFSRKLDSFIESVVVREDRERVREMTNRETILGNLKRDGAYFVSFRAVLDGKVQYYQMKAASGTGGQQEIRSMVIGFHNVDEETRKSIADKEEEIRAELERKAKAARDAAVISGLSDDFGCVIYVNTETMEEVHYRLDSLLAANIPDWEEINDFEARLQALGRHAAHPEDRAFFLEPVQQRERALQTVRRDGVFYHNFRVVLDGVTRYYQLKIVRDESSEHHIIVGMRNVDETVRHEMEVQEKLESANRSKTDFLFNMSHDIRTPMNAIIGFTQLAKKHLDDPARVADSLNKIESSGSHLLELINEVLDMSRVEAGKLHSEMKTVRVPEAVLRLVTICQESAAQRQIALTCRNDRIEHPTVVADELHINQVLMNILGNAIKYTQPGGRVDFSVEETDCDVPGYGKYVFTVADTGIGMSPEFLEHIYESFSREDRATTSEIQGTGLGMAIVKRLVDYMDGTIGIASEQGKGTTVSITLCLKLSDAPETASGTTETLAVDLSGRNVLLVEDNELNREIAVELLEEQGLNVDVAVNGIDAVAHVRSGGAEAYDFILMDIQMPLMDGFEATAEIRKLPDTDRLPIIALSANAFEEDRKKSLDAGMNDHVSKPIMIADLIAALNRFAKSGKRT